MFHANRCFLKKEFPFWVWEQGRKVANCKKPSTLPLPADMANIFSDGTFSRQILLPGEFLDVPMQPYNCPAAAHVSESSSSNRDYHLHPLFLLQVKPQSNISYQYFVQWLDKLRERAWYYQEEINTVAVFLGKEGDLSRAMVFTTMAYT